MWDIAVAGILVASMAASTWWAVRTQKKAIERDRFDQIQATGNMLAQGCESMLGANELSAVLLGVEREQLLRDDLGGLVRDERVVDAMRAATGGPMRPRAIVEVERDAEQGGGVLRFIVRPVRREDSGVAMVIIEDITQQRVAEGARNTFVTRATHELRTPLTNIRLYLETALDEGARDPATLSNALNTINREAVRLERMVGDILSVSEIEAGTLQLHIDDVRLDDLFAQLQTDYAAQAAEKQIELTFNLPPKLPVVQADRDKLGLGLHNLLGNSLKYTPSGGAVVVDVAIQAGRLTVNVRDTGIGISVEDRERIFEKFYRAGDRRVAEVTGSGLGLSIAREVIRLHGGEIMVESELNKGSSFTLTLPINTGNA